MKQLLTAVVFMLISTALVAQSNSAVTTQTGNTNDSKVTQAGGNQDATVTQTGNLNNSKVNQFTDNLGTQTAEVIQGGNSNGAKVEMDQTGGGTPSSNSAYINQAGNLNNSFQKVNAPGYNGDQHVVGNQTGNNNNLDQRILHGYTDQFEATQVGNRNTTTQRMPSATHNKGVVNQEGNDNSARQDLSGGNNGYGAPIKIKQIGNWNVADQDFVSTQTFSHKNDGLVSQVGNGNYAKQDVLGKNAEVASEVIGNNNDTRQFITGASDKSTLFAQGSGNTVRTDQTGDENLVGVKLNDAMIGNANGNEVNVQQAGDYNYLTLGIRRGDIGGDRNIVKVDQEGNGQYHRLTADGSANDIRIKATGNVGGSQYAGNRGDWAFTNGSPVWTETSDRNELDLVQDGTRNYATGVVAGDGNDINISQTGNNNLVGTNWYDRDGVAISGNNNDVNIMQTGNGNSSLNNVTGNGNAINVNQSN